MRMMALQEEEAGQQVLGHANRAWSRRMRGMHKGRVSRLCGGLHVEVGPRGLGLGQQLAVWAYPSLKVDWIWVKIWAIKWA